MAYPAIRKLDFLLDLSFLPGHMSTVGQRPCLECGVTCMPESSSVPRCRSSSALKEPSTKLPLTG